MRSVHTAFNDFAESFNSPTRVILLVLFLLSGVSAPLVKVLVTTLIRGANARDDDDDVDTENTRLVILPPAQHGKQSAWSQVRRRLRRSSLSPRIEEVDSDDDFHESGTEPSDAAGWAPLGFMRSTRKALHAKHL
jgi:hypothetical protein